MNLNISTGLQECNINEKCKVYFNPTDPVFIEKVYNAFCALDELDEKYREQKKDIEDGIAVFKMAREADAGMRAIIDGLFNENVCQPVFGEISIYAMSDGLPLWANVMLALTEAIGDTFSEEAQKANPRLEKYIKKYQK